MEEDAPATKPVTKRNEVRHADGSRNWLTRDPSVPYYEQRLQKPEMHLKFLEKCAYPNTRNALMQLHAKRASEYEYLAPGKEQTKFDANEKMSEGRWVLMDGTWRLMG